MTRVYFNIPHRELVKLCKKYPGRFKQIQKRDCPIDIENRRATIQQFLESKNKTFRGSHLHVELRRLNLYTQQSSKTFSRDLECLSDDGRIKRWIVTGGVDGSGTFVAPLNILI